MSVKKQNYLLLVTGLVLGVLVSIGHGVLAEREASRATLPVEELRTFSDVFGRIKNDYVESVEDKELLEKISPVFHAENIKAPFRTNLSACGLLESRYINLSIAKC